MKKISKHFLIATSVACFLFTVSCGKKEGVDPAATSPQSELTSMASESVPEKTTPEAEDFTGKVLASVDQL